MVDHGANVTIADKTGDTPLRSAVRNNKAGCVELILSMKFNEMQDRLNIYECILLAVQENRDEVLAIFLKYISLKYLQQNYQKKRSLLHSAIENDSRACFTRLLDFMDDSAPLINEKDFKGNTPLHLCAKLNRTEYALLLIKHGANKDEVNSENKKASDLRPNSVFGASVPSSLSEVEYSRVHRHELKRIDPGKHRYHWNCDGRDLPINSSCRLKSIFNSRILVCFHCQFCDFDLCEGCMMSYRCTEKYFKESSTVLSLRERLYDVLCNETDFKTDDQRSKFITKVIDEDLSLDQEYTQSINSEGKESPIYLAIKLERTECLKLFLKKYRSRTICAESKRILFSKLSSSEVGYGCILKTLIEAGLIDTNEKNTRGISILSQAVLANNLECISVLFQRSPDVNIKDSSSKNPLLWACIRESVSVSTLAELLKFPSLDLNVADEDDDTLLMLCASHDNKEKLTILIECMYQVYKYSADDMIEQVNRQNKNGTTVLAWSCLKGAVQSLKHLLTVFRYY